MKKNLKEKLIKKIKIKVDLFLNQNQNPKLIKGKNQLKNK